MVVLRCAKGAALHSLAYWAFVSLIPFGRSTSPPHTPGIRAFVGHPIPLPSLEKRPQFAVGALLRCRLHCLLLTGPPLRLIRHRRRSVPAPAGPGVLKRCGKTAFRRSRFPLPSLEKRVALAGIRLRALGLRAVAGGQSDPRKGGVAHGISGDDRAHTGAHLVEFHRGKKFPRQ